MRSPFRLLVAASLLTAAAGLARAQEPETPPAPAPHEAAQPADLAPIPVAEPIAPVVEPAAAAEPIAPVVESVAPAPVAEKQLATTPKRVTKKTVRKPVEKVVEAPAAPSIESKDPAASAAIAPAAASTGSAPPPSAAADPAPAAAIAPPAPAASVSVVESSSEETIPQKKLGLGSWILFGILFLAMAGIAVKFLRRRLQSPTSIMELGTIVPDVKPVPVTRL